MFDYQEFDTPRPITTSGLIHYLELPQEILRSKVTDSDGRARMAILPVTIVPGTGCKLLHSGAAQSKGTDIIISDNVWVAKGNVNFPLRRDGQLFTLDLDLLPMQTSTSAPSAFIATQKTIPGIAAGDI